MRAQVLFEKLGGHGPKDLELRIRAHALRIEQELGRSKASNVDALVAEVEVTKELEPETELIAAVLLMSSAQFSRARKLIRMASHRAKAQQQEIIYLRAIFQYAYCLVSESHISRAKPFVEFLKLKLATAVDIPEDLRSVISLFIANHLLSENNISEAWTVTRDAWDRLVGTDYWFQLCHCLATLAKIEGMRGNPQVGLTYLDLIPIRILETGSITRRNIELVRHKLSGDEPDLILDLSKRQILLKNKLSIDLGNQHLVIKLLSYFIKNQGRVISKEEIIENVWKQEYHPLRHDNKMYFTINRIRKLIEANTREPNVLLGAEGGYILSSQKRVKIQGETSS